MDAVLYAEIYLICMIVVGMLFLWSVRKPEKSAADIWLTRALGVFLLNFTANFLFTLFNRIWVWEPVVIPLSYALKTAYLLMLVLGVFCWCGYSETLLHSDLFTHPKKRIPIQILLFVICAFVLSNLLTHWIFDISPEHAYRRQALFGPMLDFLFLLSLFFSVRLLILANHEADPSRRIHHRIIASFPLNLLAAMLLSRAGESIPAICVCNMVSLLSIYIANSNHQISTDALTGINNRHNLNRFMSYKLYNHLEQIWLLMIDVDHFKKINDTWGHLEGDRALETVSSVLKDSCRNLASRPFLARYGGDEFVVVLEGEEKTARELCENIHANLARRCDGSTPYELRVSIGLGKYKSGMTYEQLVSEADEELYRMKKARKPLVSVS